MNLKQIESFLRVADLQSFTKAARQLYMSQPAVSFQIKALEEDLSVVLFKRGEKKMILTDAGQIMYREAKQMLLHYHKMKAELDDLKGLKTGKLNVSAGNIVGEYILPQLIAGFIKKYPGVTINLKITGSDQVVKQVHNHEADIGFSGAKTEESDLECRCWLEDELLLLVPPDHSWTGMKTIKGRDLLEETFIWQEKGSGTRRIVEERIGKHINLKQMSGVLEMSSSRAVLTAVEAGLGVSIVSRYAARDSLELGRVKSVQIKDINLNCPIHQIKHKQSIDGFVMNAFLEFVNAVNTHTEYGLTK